MKARDLAAKLMENPEANVELWDQYDYCLGGWAEVLPEHVQSDGTTTRFTTGGHRFDETS